MILVTGADGFIGSFLIKRLKDYKIFKGDIRDKSNVDKQVKISSIIIHLAALIDGNSKNMFDVNVNGTKNIVEAAKKYKIKKIIFMSTESISYKTHYTEQKKKSEDIVKTFDNYIILRATTVYGKGDKKSLGKIIDFIKKSPIFPLFGDGKMQPIYVKDVVQYIINSLKYDVKGTYLIAGNSKISFRDFVKLVAKNLKKKIIILHIPFCIYLAKIYEKLAKKPVITSSQIHHMNMNRTYNIDKSIKDLKHNPLDVDVGLDKTI